jgi:scyllo-inositol 2-dehydrogenase (NADP+)
VVVEKPFVSTVQQADELIALATEKKRVLSVFQNRRWDNDFLTVKKCLEDRLLGDVYLYEAHYDLFRPQVGPKWKEHAGEASGALYDLGPHLIDQALQLFGLPDTISADLVRQRPGSDVDDFFHLVMGYGAMRVVLQASNVIKKAGPHFQMHGNQGSFIKYGMDPQQADLQRGIRPGDPRWGKDQAGLYAELTKEGDSQAGIRIETIPGSYETYYQGIYQAVTAGALPPVSAVDARHGIQVIECALKSHTEQRVISFPKG